VELAGSISVGPISTRQLQAFADQLAQTTDNRGAIQTGALEEVEQEREVQVQVEQVRQVQKPLRYKALPFPGLHPIISHFARTGVLETELASQDASGFEHAFVYVAKTSLGRRFGVRETGSSLFVSKEFGKTVEFRKDGNVADNFLVVLGPYYSSCRSYMESIDADSDGSTAPCGMDPLESVDSNRAGRYSRGGRATHSHSPSRH
jgi:hypothetical protein